jgi:hypothetical protein
VLAHWGEEGQATPVGNWSDHGARACDGASAKERDVRRWVGEK